MSAEVGKRGRVIVVGSLNADYVMTTERRPEQGETVGGAELQMFVGGKGTNQAVAAARCGAEVAIIGKVGGDAMGQSVTDALAAERVDTTALFQTDAARTGVAFVVLTPDGQNSILVAPGANAELTRANIESSRAAIAAADILVAQLEVPVATIERAIELAPGDCRTILNYSPYVEGARRLLPRSSIVVANEHEANSLVDSPAATPAQAAEELLRQGAQAVILTLGARGAMFSTGGPLAQVPSPSVEVVDTTGAGDAFVGALAASLAGGSEVAEAVAKAVEVGAATTTVHGAFAQTKVDDGDGDRAAVGPFGKVS